MVKQRLWVSATASLVCFFIALQVQAASFKMGDVDMTLGGSARIDIGWQLSDFGDVQDGKLDSKTDFFCKNPGNSRIKLKTVYDTMTGYAEVGLKSDNTVSVRHIYASYDMGSGNSLLVGQTDSIISEMKPDQRLNDDLNLQGFGYLYNNRRSQVRYTNAADNVAIKVALEEDRDVKDEYVDVSGDHLAEKAIPAVILAMDYKAGGLLVTPSAFFQQFKNMANDNAAGTKDVTISTYAMALDGSYKQDIIGVNFEIWYGQNLSVFDMDKRKNNPTTVMGKPVKNTAGNDIKDINSMGGWCQFSLKSASGVFRVGGGMQQSDTGLNGNQYEDKISTMGAYSNFEYGIAKGYTVTPEIAYFDYGKDANKDKAGTGKNDLGTDIIIGTHFQYDF